MTISIVDKNKSITIILSSGRIIEIDDQTDCLLIKPNGKLDVDSYIFSLKDECITVRYTPRDFISASEEY